MVVSKTSPIKINNRNLKLYRKLGAKMGDIIDIPVGLMQKGSHQKIEVECDICGSRKYLSYQKYIINIEKYGIYSCSSKCSQIKVKKTSVERYGSEYYTQTESYKESVSKTSLDKYGETHHLKSSGVKDKISNTNLEKYGTINVFSSQIIKDKISNTNLEKYGFKNPSNNPEIIEIIKNKSLIRWEENFIRFYKDRGISVLSMLESGDYEIECGDHSFIISKKLLQNRIQIKTTICTKCNPINSHDSGLEIQLRNWISSVYKGDILINDRSISPKEIDILLPNEGIGIEFNGLYWHSEDNKDNNYHLQKHRECVDKGIELIQVWEDDWVYKNEIVKSIISNKILKSQRKIYARSCEILIVNNKDSKKFLLDNHLHGPINSKINIGLYYGDELVSLMCFSGLRRSNGSRSEVDKYEIARYCNKISTSVIGGGSKILNHFIKNNNFSEIVTYYDKSFGYKNLYTKIGFVLDGETNPGYHYIIDGIRRHRYNYRKSNLVKMGYDPLKTERQIMSDLKYRRIFGPGSFRYVLRRSSQ